jgi:hypothetical protein
MLNELESGKRSFSTDNLEILLKKIRKYQIIFIEIDKGGDQTNESCGV